MPQVQNDPNFFKKERDSNYSNWESALWRELFQNAIDQDATQIDISLSVGSGCVSIIFADNGPGMTRQVLNDVYVNIGASTKEHDPTKIGGMGRARILTCFAMQSYRILSQDYEVVGQGGHYDVYDHAWTVGFKLLIAADDTDIESMQRALDQFLYESHISARLFVNGQRMLSKSVHVGKHIRDLEVSGKAFAKVYVNKSAKTKRVIVRVNGVPMFTSTTNANAQVVVELEASTSREVLTANRDGLRYYYRESLDRYLQELAVNTNSALRSRFSRKTTNHRGGGMKTIFAAKKPAAKSIISFVAAEFQPSAYYDAPVAAPTINNGLDSFVEAKLPDDFDSWLSQTFGDIYVFDETELLPVRKVLASFQPDNWKTVYVTPGGRKQGYLNDSGVIVRPAARPYRKGGNIIRILLLWMTAVRYALEANLEVLDVTEVPFAVGFVFPDDHKATGADHRKQDGGHIFSLCPVDEQGKLRFAITNRHDLKWIMALAKHEVTHLVCSWHGEEFSSLREKIDANFDEMECLRRMKEALRSAKI